MNKKIKESGLFFNLTFCLVVFFAACANAGWYLDIYNYCNLCMDVSAGHWRYGPYATEQECESHNVSPRDSCQGHNPCYYGTCSGSDDASGGGTSGSPGSSGSLSSHFLPEPSLNDYILGRPFFTTHMSSEFSDWLRESQLRWQAYLELSRKLKLARNRNTGKTETPGEKIVIPPPPSIADSISDRTSVDLYTEYDIQASQYFYDLQMRKMGVSQQETKKPAVIPTEEESEKNLSQKLSDLHKQLEVVKSELAKLLKTNQLTTQQYEEWNSVMESAMDEAWKRGKDMLINQSLDVLAVGMERQKSNVEDQIKTANNTLNGKELLEELKRLGDIKQRTIRAQEILRGGGAAADALKESLNTADAAIDPKEFKWNLDKVYDTMTSLVGNELVQKAMTIPGSSVGRIATYAKIIVDTSYNLGQEVVAWQRQKQLDRNSPQLREAVSKMKERMEKIVAQIKDTENKLNKYRK